MSDVTEAMFAAALKKAVEVGLLPKQADAETYLKNCEAVKAVLQAALAAALTTEN
ncbi:hypothetical protein G3O06_05380 [Burkholderia sp. Ac-20345]|uniref:hypothetical protein n=1 Tax=Burkholderia sp. Ac-20345 TaxID=2703891 RepID=UPI00197C8D2B|nr:hypothetical protein [Burkholderia sp. Ac-20345]MBN3777001.1 hypothetical protein [Burkholderia sp. Ac-20345]